MAIDAPVHPDALREELMRRSAQLRVCQKLGFGTSALFRTHALRLAEIVVLLDQWLREGGPLPAAWRREGPGAARY